MATPRKYTLERLNSALENYNRTILRLSGHGLTLPIVEDPATISAQIYTQQELINVTRHFERIMREGATQPVQYHGVKTIKYMRDEIRILNRARNRVNARLLAELEKQPVTYLGEPIGTTLGEQRGGLGTELRTMYEPYKAFEGRIKPVALSSRYRRLSHYQRQTYYQIEKNRQYKVNYLLAIERELSGYAGYEELFYLIMSIPADIMGKYSRDVGLAIRYIYGAGTSIEAIEQRIKELIEAWNKIARKEEELYGRSFELKDTTIEYYNRKMAWYQGNTSDVITIIETGEEIFIGTQHERNKKQHERNKK